MVVKKVLINLTKLWKSWGVRFALTSSTIVRQIQIGWEGIASIRNFKRDSQLSFLKIPKPKIYSFASRVSRKFLLPKFFPCFTQPVNYFLFGHACKRRRFFRYAFTKFFPQFFCLFDVFHYSSPLYIIYYGIHPLSIKNNGTDSVTIVKDRGVRCLS